MPAVMWPPIFGEATADGDAEEPDSLAATRRGERTERSERAQGDGAREQVTTREAPLADELTDLNEP